MNNTVSLSELVPIMKELFSQGKTVTLTARGSSMRPLLRDGVDSVVLKGLANGEELRRLDVPLYRREDGKYVLHRIVKVNPDGFDMCGDGQVAVEKGIPKENIEAIAEAFIIKGKYVPVSSKKYRLYSALWCAVRPVRGYIFKIAGLLKRR